MRPYLLTRGQGIRNQPVRTIGRGHPGQQTVHFPSRKNEGVVICESRLEADFCLWLEYDLEVVSYRPQPQTIPLFVDAVLHRYTPDFLAVYFTGEEKAWEVKPHGVYQWPAYLRKIAAAKEYFAAQGQGFELITDEAIRRQPHLRSLRWLYAHAHVIGPHARRYLWDWLKGAGGSSTLGHLLQQGAPVSICAIADAIFCGQLAIRLDTPLGPSSLLTIQGVRRD